MGTLMPPGCFNEIADIIFIWFETICVGQNRTIGFQKTNYTCPSLELHTLESASLRIYREPLLHTDVDIRADNITTIHASLVTAFSSRDIFGA